jgi:putative FmdB family regulatory protein
MPAYDFKCKKCDVVIEVKRASSDASPVPCPECGDEMKQVFHPVGVHFKGSGFHNTDNRKPEPRSETCDSAGSGPACSDCPAAK